MHRRLIQQIWKALVVVVLEMFALHIGIALRNFKIAIKHGRIDTQQIDSQIGVLGKRKRGACQRGALFGYFRQ